MTNNAKRNASKRPRQPNRAGVAAPVGQVRIIGGLWRGRKLPVVDVAGLRPTGDRVRETVFNWLQMQVPGSHCLDLFAGTGALGLEAASRGAASVTLVEPDGVAVNSLRSALQMLNCTESVHLHQTRFAEFLSQNTRSYDIVFVDPPFKAEWQNEVLQLLTQGHLREAGLVYLEKPTGQVLSEQAISAYHVLKERRFGDVTVMVLQRT